MASLIDQMNQGILARRQSLTPLLVVAPSTRCGTTLMQRLLTASREMLVYGENALLFEVMPQVYGSVLQTFGGDAGEAAERLRAKVVGGDTAGWIAGVLTDPNRMKLLAAQQLIEHFVLHQEDAAALGFAHWGVKYPLANTSALPVLASLMPNLKVLVIHRHILDALKSAKGRGWIEGGAQAEAFAASWANNLAWLSAWEFPGKITVRYDDMIADPDTWLPKIAAFAGIERVEPSVLAVKVNTFEGSGEGENPSGYTSPIDLTDAEQRRALAVAAPGLTAGGY